MPIRIIFAVSVITVLNFAVFGQTPVKKMVLPGLKNEVTVRRDARWVPYIEAKTDEDLYFAQGFVTASDRLFQMDLLRRVARGRTAEIFGSQGLEQDKYWRRYGFSAIAEQSLGYLSPTLRSALESYSRGVNAYIATLTDETMPAECKILQYKPEQWQPTDTIIIGKILAESLSTTWQDDILRASLQSLPKDKFDDLNNQITPYDVVLFGDDKVVGSSGYARRGPRISKKPLKLRSSDVTLAPGEAKRNLGKKVNDDSQARVAGGSDSDSFSNNIRVASVARYAGSRSICCTNPRFRSAPPEAKAMPLLRSLSGRVGKTELFRTSIGNAANDDLPSVARDVELRAASLASVGLYAEDLAASNNWVISGKRTADGKPLLANDPHLSPTIPGIWYLTEIESPNVHAAGVTFPGVPGIVLGHNDAIAWGATNVGPDVQDVYSETFNEKGEYKTANGWAKPVVRTETIEVRTSFAQTGTKPTKLDVTTTSHGPIISEENGKKYALRWTAFDPKNNEFEAFFGLDRAKNWTDFQNTLKTYGGAAQNFVYADVKGNIGWYAAGRIPIRKKGDGAFPYDGSTSDGDWTGYIPFEELPHLYNPPSGMIVTANQRTVGTSYKYKQFARDTLPPWRANRIKTLLESKQKITMDDVRDVQLDDFNRPLDNLAKYIVANKAATSETLTLIGAWDGRMVPDSRAALLVNEIRGCMADRIAAENQPAPNWLIRERVLDRALHEDLTRWLPRNAMSFGQLTLQCDKATRSSLADPKRFGPDETKWTWGRVWQSNYFHPLAAVPFVGSQFASPSIPIRGSGQTPNVGSYVSMRLVASPGNWDITRHAIPLGESGDPRSPYFKDEFDAWQVGKPFVFPFSKPAIQKAAAEVLGLAAR